MAFTEAAVPQPEATCSQPALGPQRAEMVPPHFPAGRLRQCPPLNEDDRRGARGEPSGQGYPDLARAGPELGRFHRRRAGFGDDDVASRPVRDACGVAGPARRMSGHERIHGAGVDVTPGHDENVVTSTGDVHVPVARCGRGRPCGATRRRSVVRRRPRRTRRAVSRSGSRALPRRHRRSCAPRCPAREGRTRRAPCRPRYLLPLTGGQGVGIDAGRRPRGGHRVDGDGQGRLRHAVARGEGVGRESELPGDGFEFAAGRRPVPARCRRRNSGWSRGRTSRVIAGPEKPVAMRMAATWSRWLGSRYRPASSSRGRPGTTRGS